MKNCLNFKHLLYCYTEYFYDAPFGKARAKLCTRIKCISIKLSAPYIRKIINSFSKVVSPGRTFSVFTVLFTTCRIYIYIHRDRRVSYLIWFGHVIMCVQSGCAVLLPPWCWKLENQVVIATDRFGFAPLKEKRRNIVWQIKKQMLLCWHA
jgi:hypothetical protein